jgi:transcriptional regulator with XRE-family HTH domain
MRALEQRVAGQDRDGAKESQTFGASLYALRTAASKTQAETAAIAGISNSYYCGIENGKRLPPPRRTAARLARAVGLSGREADALVAMAVVQRGSDRRDDDLPPDVRLLICDLRTHAFEIPTRFVAGLRAKLREAVP